MNSSPSTSSKIDLKPMTLEDLQDWKFPGTALAVLGHPVKHSVSPEMHRAALLAMAQTQLIYADWDYFKLDVPPEKLPEALPLLWERGFHGLNLTIPHKVDAIDLVAEIDPEAKVMGAVNTLKRLPSGGYAGFNSDGFGIEEALRRSLSQELKDAKICLLGAGGAARATAFHCLFQGCEHIAIGNRNQERLNGLKDLLATQGFADRVSTFDLSKPLIDDPLGDTDVIINATSLGLKVDDASPINLLPFPSSVKVYDMTYGHVNALARQAKVAGLEYEDGLSMLVWQGVRSLEIWSETNVPAQPMMTAACKAKGFSARSI